MSPSDEGSSRRVCGVAGCGRPAFARGLCQTHHRHWMKEGRVRHIRPYRPRSTDTVSYAGFRFSRACAEKLDQYAARRHLAPGAAIAEILEAWGRAGRRRR